MKNVYKLLAALCLCMGLVSCSDSHPAPLTPLTPLESSSSGSIAGNETVVPDSIDTADMAQSDVYSLPGVGLFKLINSPGMVIYTDQSQGATLAYVNKTTRNSFYFCFDPTCSHYDCPANILHLTNNMVYCNGKLYAVCPEPERGGGGTSLYSVNLDSTDLHKCYTSDGNEIYNPLVWNNTILFSQGRTDGGEDLIAYDTKSGKTSVISDRYELDIGTYFAARDAIYYTFIGDTYLYRTNDFFETSEKLFDIEKMSNRLYGDQTHLYGVEYVRDDTGVVYAGRIVRCSLETGDMEVVYDGHGEPLNFVGIDDDCCYFSYTIQAKTPYKRSDGAPIVNPSGGVLYRIPKSGGDEEVIMNDIDYDISYVGKIGDDLYVLGHKYYDRGSVGGSKTMTGILNGGTVKEITPR